jgi:hypothetical protein
MYKADCVLIYLWERHGPARRLFRGCSRRKDEREECLDRKLKVPAPPTFRMSDDVDMRVCALQTIAVVTEAILKQSTNQNNEEDEWVRITSSDGHSFLIKRRMANASGTLKNMLSADSSKCHRFFLLLK